MTDTNWEQYSHLPQFVLVGLCALLVLALLTAGITTAAPFATYNSQWTGTTDLRDAAMANANTTVIIDSEATNEPPSSATTTAFVLGVPNETTTIETTAADVLTGGGTVVITDEVPTTTNTLLERLGVTARVEPGPIRDPRSYDRQPILPTVTTTNATGTIAGTSLTLNHAGTIAPNKATVLATTSQFAYVDQNQNEQFDSDESLAARPVMTREAVSNGTVIVISDSSVFINAMFEQAGNQALAEWLYEDHETLLVTGSAVRPVPQLVTLLLWIKSTPVSQVAFLAAAVGIVFVTTRKRYRSAITSRLQQNAPVDISQTMADDITSQSPSASEYESGLMKTLRRNHPEWDQDTIRRLVTAVITHRQSNDDSENKDTSNEQR